MFVISLITHMPIFILSGSLREKRLVSSLNLTGSYDFCLILFKYGVVEYQL